MSKKNINVLDESVVISDIKCMALSLNKEYKSMLCLTEILYALYHDYLSYDIERVYWANRDRIVIADERLLPLFYSLKFFFSNNIDISLFKNYGTDLCDTSRNANSCLDTSVFIHGSGMGTSIGFALGEEILADLFNEKDVTLFNYYTYLICTSSSLEESNGFDTLSIVSDFNLTNYVVICLNDEDAFKRERMIDVYLALDFEVIYIKNMQNDKEIHKAFSNVSKTKKPVFIIGDTYELEDIIGSLDYNLENTKLFKAEIKENIKDSYASWYDNYKTFMKTESEDKKEALVNFLNNETISLKLDKIIDADKIELNKSLKDVNSCLMSFINKFTTNFLFLSAYEENLLGVSGDNHPYNILFKNKSNIIGDIMNGFSLLGFHTIVQSPLRDVSKMIGSIRHSAMMNLPVTYVFYSDTFMGNNLGANSPINELGMLRGNSNLEVYRPADFKELMGSWNSIFEENAPTALILSNFKIDSYKYTLASEVSLGGYVISEVKNKLDLIILSSGVDLKIAYKLKEELLKNFIEARIVSVPCLKKFINSDIEYFSQTLPKGYKRVVIELSNDSMWQSLLGVNDLFFHLDGYVNSYRDADVLKVNGLDMTSMVIKIKESL